MLDPAVTVAASGIITVMPTSSRATVHLLAGLNGAGTSTHARPLERECPAARFTLDEWMLRSFQTSYDDPRYSDKAIVVGHRPVLHYLPASVDTAIRHVGRRRRGGDAYSHALDADAVRHLARLFEVPSPDEGIELRVVEG